MWGGMVARLLRAEMTQLIWLGTQEEKWKVKAEELKYLISAWHLCNRRLVGAHSVCVTSSPAARIPRALAEG